MTIKQAQNSKDHFPSLPSTIITGEEISDPIQLCKDPLISVVIITYNQESYIDDAIKGVVNQKTEFSFELIIGEDSSTDHTRDIVLAYQKKYPQLIRVVIKHKNSDTSRNFARTMDRIRGDYFFFCEGDDFWIDANKLQFQVEAMRRNPQCDISFHPVNMIKADSREHIGIMGEIYKQDTILPVSEVLSRGLSFMPSCALCIKSDFFNCKANHDFIRKYSFSWMLKFLPSVEGGALYINNISATYRVCSLGSWTQRAKENPLIAVRSYQRFSDGFDIANKITSYRFNDEIERIKVKLAVGILCRRDISVDVRKTILSGYSKKLSLKQRFKIFIMSSSGIRRVVCYYPCKFSRSIYCKIRLLLAPN